MAITFDQDRLLERVDHDRAFLAETVEMLAGDGRALMNDLQRAIGAGDPGAVGRTAHALKGMISNFCAAPAHEAALAVERVGKGGDLAGAPDVARILSERLEALIAELERFIRSDR
jgi:HPt (histidine-containing phosphotransfer) domain-containing protein